MEIDNNIVNNNRLNNVVNVYDEKKHSNVECQKIKEEWEKNCDCLKDSNKCLKERKDCLHIFDNYYKCHINQKNI
jgi:hypothetical protein